MLRRPTSMDLLLFIQVAVGKLARSRKETHSTEKALLSPATHGCEAAGQNIVSAKVPCHLSHARHAAREDVPVGS